MKDRISEEILGEAGLVQQLTKHLVERALETEMTAHLGYEKYAASAEGAKFWLSVLTELQSRGVQDILIACVDGLKGSPDAIENVFPRTEVQLCIVHLVRNSLRYVSWKDRKAVARDLR